MRDERLVYFQSFSWDSLGARKVSQYTAESLRQALTCITPFQYTAESLQQSSYITLSFDTTGQERHPFPHVMTPVSRSLSLPAVNY